MSVTADQAFEARDAGEPVMITGPHALKLVASHDQLEDFLIDAEYCRDPSAQVDLADVLEWLGY